MKNLVSLILIVISIGILYYFINPKYQEIKTLRVDGDNYASILQKLSMAGDELNQKIAESNAISGDNMARLAKILPSSADNVQLVMDVQNIALKNHLVFKGLNFGAGSAQSKPTATVANDSDSQKSQNKYDSMSLEFTVTSTMGNFISFLQELEQSDRIIDVDSMSFNSSDKDDSIYDVSIKTYWLNPASATVAS